MNDLTQAFEARVQEIDAYLELLTSLEKQVQDGPPRISENGSTITVQQQRILYSSIYLQLYNLLEATMTQCIEAVSAAITLHPTWYPGDLTEKLRREWVRSIARTHTELNFENRLEAAVSLCEHLVQARPISDFKIERGAGGSWDDKLIEEVCDRMGLRLRVSKEVLKTIKQHFRDDQGALAFIKDLRNRLAHGSISFAECGEGVAVSDLKELKTRTEQYLREVVKFFEASLDGYEYLIPKRRPTGRATSE